MSGALKILERAKMGATARFQTRIPAPDDSGMRFLQEPVAPKHTPSPRTPSGHFAREFAAASAADGEAVVEPGQDEQQDLWGSRTRVPGVRTRRSRAHTNTVCGYSS